MGVLFAKHVFAKQVWMGFILELRTRVGPDEKPLSFLSIMVQGALVGVNGLPGLSA